MRRYGCSSSKKEGRARWATSIASLHSGTIRLDNAPDPAQGTETHYLYNIHDNLIMYSAASIAPDIIAPDSICY